LLWVGGPEGTQTNDSLGSTPKARPIELPFRVIKINDFSQKQNLDFIFGELKHEKEKKKSFKKELYRYSTLDLYI
jgi:hypothetical protein